MLNSYIWHLYLESGGNNVVEMFRRNIGEELTEEYAEEIIRMKKYFCIMGDLVYEEGQQIRDLIQIIKRFEEETEDSFVENE